VQMKSLGVTVNRDRRGGGSAGVGGGVAGTGAGVKWTREAKASRSEGLRRYGRALFPDSDPSPTVYLDAI